MVPFCGSPQSVCNDKPERPRMITDDSFGGPGSSKNGSTPTLLHASLRFSTLDKIAKRLGTLVKKASVLGKATKLTIGVLMGVVDLIEAYRQLSVDTTERWASGFSFLNELNELEFGIDERFGFGGTLHPACFCRMTNANVVIFDQKLTRELVMPVPLLQEWREHIEQEPFSLHDGVLHRQIYGRAGTYAQRMDASDDLEEEGVVEEQEWPFQGISRADGLTHSKPLRQAVAPMNCYWGITTEALGVANSGFERSSSNSDQEKGNEGSVVGRK